VPSDIMSAAVAVLVIILWIFLIRRFVYPRFSRRRAEDLQLARLVYSGVLAVALVFVSEMLTLSGPLKDAFILASALCFAVSVPCLAAMVLLITAAIDGGAGVDRPRRVDQRDRRSGVLRRHSERVLPLPLGRGRSVLGNQWPGGVLRLGATRAVRHLGGAP
jgi:hypothetical protein